LSVAMVRAMPHLPFTRGAEAALERARAALPPERRRAMARLEKRILVGAPAGQRVRRTVGPVDDGVLEVFERCFTESLSMAFDYVDGAGTPSARRVECVALVLHAPSWYVLTWDLEKDASRLFRLDRMVRAAVGTPLAVQHPLSDVLVEEVASEANPWRRRPIG